MLKDGWQDPDGKSYLTRIWAAEQLTQMFMDAAFGYFDIGYPENRATVILRDENKRNIEYEDTAETRRMHDLLVRYNRLLERTFVDTPLSISPASNSVIKRAEDGTTDLPV